ncbi:MAG: hypothetical protein IT331_14430 [Anaerolineae bacterium]|nr:hypothetical protein [Anaerolineae bacterium]
MPILNLRLATKTRIPRPIGYLLERPRLLRLLDHSLDVPLTILSAPAGFGKTNLLCQWLAYRRDRNTPRVCGAWLSLDEHDENPRNFLSYFVAALRTVYPDGFAATEKLLSSSQISSEQTILVSLVNELDELGAQGQAKKEHLVLVLDDYHLVNNDAVNSLLSAILRHPPQRLHLVLCCRHDPALPLSRWRTENRLLELRPEDLRFNRTETEQFLRQAVSIDWTPAQLDALDTRTEGWAAALRLVTLTVHDAAGADRIAGAHTLHHHHLMNYLLDEVIARLPAQLESCLIKISILDRFNAELCQQVCAEMGESGVRFIAELQRANIFLVGLDEAGTWFRFHTLFQETLRSQLALRYDDLERAALHKRAMAWFARNNFIEEALAHAFAADDITGAAELVATHRHRLMDAEQWQRLEHWLAMFCDDNLACFPDLLLAKAWVMRVTRFDLTITAALARQASDLVPKTDLAPDLRKALQAEADVLLGMDLYRSAADADQFISIGKQALEAAPAQRYTIRSNAYILMATGYQTKGEIRNALEGLRRYRTEEVLSGYADRRRAFVSEALIQWLAGNLPAMLELTKAPVGREASESLLYFDTDSWRHYLRAAASYQRDDLKTAETHAAFLLNDPNPSGSFRPMLESMFILASVYQARKMPERAVEVLEEALSWTMEKHSDMLSESVRAFRAQLALMQGDMVTANRWLAGYTDAGAFGVFSGFNVPFLSAIRIWIAQNSPESRQRAAELLARLQEHLTMTHNARFLIEVYALWAMLYESRGDRARALEMLKQATVLGEPGGFIRLYVDLGEPMSRLLAELARRERASDYIKTVLAVFQKTYSPPQPAQSAALIEPLSAREFVVLQLLAKRFSNKEIAQELIISPLTVKAHTEHIYQKLGVNSRQDAVKLAIELGLLPHA